MKFCIIFALCALLVGCKNAEKNTSPSGHIPESMQCPASTDPNQGCPSSASDAVSPVAPADRNLPVGQKPPKILKAIVGTCEMYVEGEKTARACDELQLTVISRRKKEVRHARIQGFNITFSDLNQESYRFRAASEKYDVKADADELSPGQTVKIRVRAKPRQ